MSALAQMKAMQKALNDKRVAREANRMPTRLFLKDGDRVSFRFLTNEPTAAYLEENNYPNPNRYFESPEEAEEANAGRVNVVVVMPLQVTSMELGPQTLANIAKKGQTPDQYKANMTKGTIFLEIKGNERIKTWVDKMFTRKKPTEYAWTLVREGATKDDTTYDLFESDDKVKLPPEMAKQAIPDYMALLPTYGKQKAKQDVLKESAGDDSASGGDDDDFVLD